MVVQQSKENGRLWDQKWHLVVVHPDFDGASRVDAVRVLVAGERVRVERAEDVADARARDRLQRAAARPDAERHLQVLAAPHVHALVVRTLSFHTSI